LFEELVKADFKKKYKRTILGMFWSLLSPLLQLIIMNIVFKVLFGAGIPHFTIYLFSGMLVWNFYQESTNGGMMSLISNAGIITKVNVPKYLFLLSKNVSACINFVLTLVIYFIFVGMDGIQFTWKFLLLVFPIGCLLVFNIGVGFILSALFVFFRDTQYLYSIFSLLLMYLSAVFYQIDMFPEKYQILFYCNPLYVYIRYFRAIVIDGHIPTLGFHLLALFYAAAVLFIGMWTYKRNNFKFLFYM
jgi:ABC-type polysaccharide/polyol phosphate export permease